MSEENVEAMRSEYARFARRDFSGVAKFSDEVEFVVSPEAPDAGTYRGEAARQWLRAWVASFEELTIEATEFLDAGDKVVVGMLQRGRAGGSEATIEGRWWQVITFRNGVTTRIEMYPKRAEALEAAGLRE